MLHRHGDEDTCGRWTKRCPCSANLFSFARLGQLQRQKQLFARWRHRSTVVDVAPSDAIRLAVSLLDSRNARSRQAPRQDIQPAGASVTLFSPSEGASVEVKGEADIVQLFLEHTSTEAMLDTPFACPPMFNLCDDLIRSLIMRILVVSTRSELDNKLKIEKGLHGLAVRLERHANSWRSRSTTPSVFLRGGLAPTAFRRVNEMIAGAIDDATSLSLAEMAVAAGLSVTHFSRAFRRQTGITPHNYLVRRRMERAVSLLRDKRISVAEIADKVGFATSAHFVAAFRAAMGVTPAALRDAL